jgi:hypothetical protein
MLSGFFKTKPALNRFEITEAFKQPAIILNKLHDKKKELKESSEEKGPGSIDYRKYLVVADLMKRIDTIIDEFNESKITSHSEEIIQIIKTSRKILEIISAVRKTEERTLMTSRNNQREQVSNAVYYGTFGTTFLAGSALSIGTLGKLASLFYIAPTVSKSIHEATGLNDLSPTSVRLLNELTIILNHINANLTKQTGTEVEVKESEMEDFICPITQQIINDPVVCTLDGDWHSYEKTAIEKWFKTSRRSPLSGSEIPPDKSPQDVLIKHYNYASLLEKFRREHPSTTYTSACL